jgi:hypothetical protein
LPEPDRQTLRVVNLEGLVRLRSLGLLGAIRVIIRIFRAIWVVKSDSSVRFIKSDSSVRVIKSDSKGC